MTSLDRRSDHETHSDHEDHPPLECEYGSNLTIKTASAAAVDSTPVARKGDEQPYPDQKLEALANALQDVLGKLNERQKSYVRERLPQGVSGIDNLGSEIYGFTHSFALEPS